MSKYKIPLFKLNFDKREEQAVLKTIKSHWISSGPRTYELELKFAKLLGAKYSLSVTNCTAALHLAMIICGIKTGDEVICPSLTFVATVNAIRYVGANPVFCDISSENDLTISPEDIEKKITQKTKAILIMHYAGFPCDMERIIMISKKYNIRIIEDACHAPLSEYKGRKLGTIGAVSCYSFFSNKNISTGEGGMLVTNNDKYYEKAKLIRSHGMTVPSYDRSINNTLGYDVLELGYNYRLDDIRASIALVQLSKLKKDIKQREKIRKLYLKYLKEIQGIIIPFLGAKGIHSNYIFPVLVENRDKIRKLLAQKGIQTSIHYQPVHRFKIYKKYFTELPVTDEVANKLLTLPMYSSLKEAEIIYIKECLRKILK